MDLLIKVVSPITVRRNEEDVIDRLNFQYTSYVFMFSAVLIMSKQYMASAIECWTPAEFRKGWIEYARDFCLIENTYWVPMEDPSLPSLQQRHEAKLPYYQWVQFVLAILAFMFMVPHIFWRSVSWHSGIHVRAVVEASKKAVDDPSCRPATLKKISTQLHQMFSFDTGRNSGLFIRMVSRFTDGQYVSLCYIFMKVLFIINIIAQIAVLHVFLGFNPLYSFDWQSDWKHSGLFPRSTMCDFEVRTKGNVQRYSVQCVLALNMFNEKIFIVLFFWLVFLLLLTIINTLQWVMQLYSSSRRRTFACKMLRSVGIHSPPTQRSVDESMEMDTLKKPLLEDSLNKFSDFVLFSPDKALLLRLVSANCGEVVCSQLIRELYLKQKQ